MKILDCHTHNADSIDGIINATIDTLLYDGKFYSMGIHPWNSDKYVEISVDEIIKFASPAQIVAIGETGFDKQKGADQNQQRKMTIKHIEASEILRKPMILHIVKAWEHIISLRKQIKPNQPWIIHGFRGKPQLADQLINNGFYISIGEKFNIESIRQIPNDRILTETDESKLGINEIIRNIASAKEINFDEMKKIIGHTTSTIFLNKKRS